jgi:glycosyltransferase involved in cell wall biosynthesis
MRLAFVTQRCGLEVNGGAELVCRQVAEHLSDAWEIEILTTCALDYVTWADHYPAETSEINGVTVRRFPVEEPRNIMHFNLLSETLQLRRKTAPRAEQVAWMKAQGPWSPKLLEYIGNHKQDYDLFVFYGYLYAQVFFGLPAVSDRAVLVPFCHDEWMIDLPIFNELFDLARQVIYSTHAERDFLLGRFPHLDPDGPVIGTGISAPEDVDGDRFCRHHKLEPGYLLYLGRIDHSKGCGELFDFYREALKTHENLPKLVALGRAVMELPSEEWFFSPGFVSEPEKWDAIEGAGLIVLPSRYESLSIAVIEGWFRAKPALVNGRCDVLVDQCKRSRGGLWYDNQDEFNSGLETLLSEAGAQFGQQGQAFAEQHYAWPHIVEKYIHALADSG